MSVLINFKICDNAEECGGIESCVTGALSWDGENKTIQIDNDKCISCGLCEAACEVGAIQVAQNEEEYVAIQKEYDEDTRQLSDLMIDRYGAQSIQYLIDENSFDDQILHANKLVVAELFKNDTIECMLKSIPIKQLFDGVDIKYRKVELKSDELLKKYQINKLPALVFFKDGKLLGKVEGHYGTNNILDLKNKIDNILEN